MSEEQYETIAKVLFDVAFSSWKLNLKLWDKKLFDDMNKPKINDYVIEISNPFVPKLHAVGKLVFISDDGWSYKIERLDGIVQSWENAKFIKIADETSLQILRD